MLTFKAGKVAIKRGKAVAKGVTKVATKATRAVIKGVKYVISKGKVLLKGIAGTRIGKQFKRLKDLGKGLLDRMRFKAFRIRVTNRRFRLEGLINPWVLLASGKIQYIDKADLPSFYNQETSNPGDEVTTLAGNKKGTVVTTEYKLKSR